MRNERQQKAGWGQQQPAHPKAEQACHYVTSDVCGMAESPGATCTGKSLFTKADIRMETHHDAPRQPDAHLTDGNVAARGAARGYVN